MDHDGERALRGVSGIAPPYAQPLVLLLLLEPPEVVVHPPTTTAGQKSKHRHSQSACAPEMPHMLHGRSE
jgi:hypothetical protein